MKQITTKSYNFCQALTAIKALTQEELIFLKKELEKQAPKGRKILHSKESDDHSFFLFGKWPDFENADTLRRKAWKKTLFS